MPSVHDQKGADMTDKELTTLMSEVARLLHRRSSTPRVQGIALAHRKLLNYALRNGLTETWADRVIWEFVCSRHPNLAAAA